MTEQEKKQLMIEIQRIYLRDTSFETPNVPNIFRSEWQPQVEVDLNIANDKVAEDTYEVVLRVTVVVKNDDKTAFLIEVNQAGIFGIKNPESEDQLNAILGVYCPSALFPYAREVIADLVGKGSFPPLHLAHISFESLYQQKLSEEQQKEKKK